MKIYFSGAVRGGNEDWDNYAQIILYLKKYGEVLTTHFTNGVFGIGKTFEMSEEEIFQTYLREFKEVDIVVQDVSVPSIGVGFDAARAVYFRKPILCLYREGSRKKLSSVIAGNKGITFKTYKTLGEAFKAIDTFFEKNKK